MTDDIVARLRGLACISGHGELGDAADEIERLRGEVERLTRERDEAREAASVLRVVSDGTVARLEEVEEERDAAIARAEAAERELSAHMETCVTQQICIDKIIKDRDAAEAKVAKLREALTFYASHSIYRVSTVYMRGSRGMTAIEHDGGERARTALQDTEQ